jgi:ribosomal protein L21E
MAKENEVKKGDVVKVIIEVGSEGAIPTVRNFYTGKIVEIVEGAEHCFYVRIAKLDRLIPVDRVKAPKKGKRLKKRCSS